MPPRPNVPPVTPPDDVVVRVALPSDAEPLARLHVDVWEDAYADLMADAVFRERRATLPQRVERWRTLLSDGATRTTVAEHAGLLIGFATVGPPRAEGAVGVGVGDELRALYVRASWWDRRVGHSLLTAAVGERAAYLWVLEGNDRAIGFYRRQGFAEDGATRRDDDGTELRMIRERQSSTRTSSA